MTINNRIIKEKADARERTALAKIAQKASRRAREASLALGLTVKSIENGYIVETLPSGQKRKIEKIGIKTEKPHSELKKGMTICRK